VVGLCKLIWVLEYESRRLLFEFGGAGIRSHINHVCLGQDFANTVGRGILSTLGTTSPLVEGVDI
jgi:hypothetical protein